jgi:hypothetical protein
MRVPLSPATDGARLDNPNKTRTLGSLGRWPVTSDPRPIAEDDLETAIDLAIAACDGDVRATVRALIVANNFLESEVRELMKAVSHAYARGRFQSYSG